MFNELVSEEMNWIWYCASLITGVESLDTNMNDDSSGTFLDNLVDVHEKHNPLSVAEHIEQVSIINKLLMALDKNSRDIIVMYYGLAGQPRLNYVEIGKIYNLSDDCIQQRQKKAMAKMRIRAKVLNINFEF